MSELQLEAFIRNLIYVVPLVYAVRCRSWLISGVTIALIARSTYLAFGDLHAVSFVSTPLAALLAWVMVVYLREQQEHRALKRAHRRLVEHQLTP